MGADELFRRTDGVVTPEAQTAHLSRIFSEVVQERIDQDEKWGGPGHDDQHNLYDWREFIAYRLNRMKTYDSSPEGIADSRRRLVQVAALAVAALQSLDRQVAADA